jgi:dUTP pyrophosphatase
MKIRVKLDEGAFLPERAHETDAGADIRTPVTVKVPARGSAVVHTGVHVELPYRTVGMVKSKSGLNINHGIVSEGVIDEGFDGEIVVKLYNLSDIPYKFDAGDKMTQLVVMPVCYMDYVEAEEIEAGERGSDGYGSTGR